jgi:hypothetical protein
MCSEMFRVPDIQHRRFTKHRLKTTIIHCRHADGGRLEWTLRLIETDVLSQLETTIGLVEFLIFVVWESPGLVRKERKKLVVSELLMCLVLNKLKKTQAHRDTAKSWCWEGKASVLSLADTHQSASSSFSSSSLYLSSPRISLLWNPNQITSTAFQPILVTFFWGFLPYRKGLVYVLFLFRI